MQFTKLEWQPQTQIKCLHHYKNHHEKNEKYWQVNMLQDYHQRFSNILRIIRMYDNVFII